MTTEDLAKLTPEQRRIKIAAACGFENIGMHMGQLVGDHPKNLAKAIPVPNYAADLNACMEMERLFDAKLAFKYSVYLRWIIDRDFRAGNPPCVAGYIFHATASQRVDAFLLAND